MTRIFTESKDGTVYVSVNGRRKVKQWVGRTPDSMPPETVRLRIFEGCDGICLITGQKIQGKRWVVAHKIAVGDEGPNEERNLFPALESEHQKETGRENSQRATERRKKAKDVGASQPRKKWPQRTRTNPETGLKERYTGFRWKPID